MPQSSAAAFEDVPVVSLTTARRGRVVTRPMFVSVKGGGRGLLFLVHRRARLITDVKACTSVSVAYVSLRYAAVMDAFATVADDPIAVREYWQPGLLRWIPGGPGDCIVIEVPTTSVEVWEPRPAEVSINRAGRSLLSAAELTARYPGIVYPSHYAPSAARYDVGGLGLLDDVYGSGDLRLCIDFLALGGGRELDASGIVIATSWGRPPIHVITDNACHLGESWRRLVQARPAKMSDAVAALQGA